MISCLFFFNFAYSYAVFVFLAIYCEFLIFSLWSKTVQPPLQLSLFELRLTIFEVFVIYLWFLVCYCDALQALLQSFNPIQIFCFSFRWNWFEIHAAIFFYYYYNFQSIFPIGVVYWRSRKILSGLASKFMKSCVKYEIIREHNNKWEHVLDFYEYF